MNAQTAAFYRPTVPATPSGNRKFSAAITKDRFFTKEDLQHITDRRNALAGRLDDSQISELIARRSGWAQTAVEFQIQQLLDAGRILPNPVQKPAWSLPSI